MVIAVDIGNSNIVIGVWDNEQWLQIHRVETHANAIDEKAAWATVFKAITATHFIHPPQIILSSVVPNKTIAVKTLLEINLSATVVVVNPSLYEKLNIITNNKEEIGTDLIANAVAARKRYEGVLIIVDFGTALTFTTVAEHGEIVGVAIAPGIKTALRALFENTAQLPEVPLEVPASVLGKSTIHALQAGVVWGYVALVEGMVERIKSEIAMPCTVIATGGLSFIISNYVTAIDSIQPNLTLNGLLDILELTSPHTLLSVE